MTNLEKIRSMSQYELGELIYLLVDCENRIYCDGCPLSEECDSDTGPGGWIEQKTAQIVNRALNI